MAPPSKNNPSTERTETPRRKRRERRVSKAQPAPAEIAAEAASIYADTFDAPPSAEDIAAEAYAIYQARGAQHGRDAEDWFEAERRISERRRQR